MVCEAVAPPLVAVTATGRPTWTPPTKKVMVPVGEQLGAARLQMLGVTVVVTVKGTGYWGDPVAGLVMVVAEEVAVTKAEMPVKAMDGAGVRVGLVFSTKVALCGPSVVEGGLNPACSRQAAPGVNEVLVLAEQPEVPVGTSVKGVLDGAGVKRLMA